MSCSLQRNREGLDIPVFAGCGADGISGSSSGGDGSGAADSFPVEVGKKHGDVAADGAPGCVVMPGRGNVRRSLPKANELLDKIDDAIYD